MTVALPHNEAKHLVALRRFDIMDTMAEQAYDDITRLAPNACTRPRPQLDLAPSGYRQHRRRDGHDHPCRQRQVSRGGRRSPVRGEAGERNRVMHIDCG